MKKFVRNIHINIDIGDIDVVLTTHLRRIVLTHRYTIERGLSKDIHYGKNLTNSR
jgi:hypothetical protein